MAGSMRVYFSGLGEFSSEIQVKKLAAAVAAREILKEFASVVEKQAKINATMRPGPRVLTGALRSSISRSSVKPVTSGIWYVEVGPTMPYGRRIELGYMGMTDSLGRTYHQQPYPFLGPAVHFLETVAGRVIVNRYAEMMVRA